MKISYINSICSKNDAVSNSIRNELTWLLSDGGHNVRFYAYECDYGDLNFFKIGSPSDIIFDHHFQTSDLIVLHFGVYSPLFDIIPVAPKGAKKVVVFHNITPKEFLPKSAHELIERSFNQMYNLIFADHVVCVSKTNQSVLVQAGIDRPCTILPLAVHSESNMPDSKPSFDDAIIRAVFIGRFVRSKGAGDLLAAFDSIMESTDYDAIVLDFIGNLKFSDTQVVSELEKGIDDLMSKHKGRIEIRLHGSADEAMKNRILQEADIFILPTKHEGFCVPILEAFANGCQVITYNNSNTPLVSGGLASLVETGNVEQLAFEINRAIKLTQSSQWVNDGGYYTFTCLLAKHIKQFHPDKVKKRFFEFIDYIANS
jgi:glycosyltransferase involved in cell wall biosynthesis